MMGSADSHRDGWVEPSKAQVRTLQIISDLDVGGAQVVVCTMVDHLALLGCEPIVCTFRDGPLRHNIERLGIQVEVIPDRRYSVLAFPWFISDMIRIGREIARLMRGHEVNVVQTHLLRSLDFLVLFLRRDTPLRVVLWTFHSVAFELTTSRLHRHRWLLGPKKRLHRLLYRIGALWVDGFVAVSDEVGESLVETIGPIGDKVTVVCNGVDTRAYCNTADTASVRSHLELARDTRLLIMTARLTEAKGHRYLIEALASIVPHFSDVHALLIGDGPLMGELQLLLEQQHLESHIHFLGNRHDVPELLAASEIFVLPSLWEGLSMALLEAMAAAKPIVATAVSGTMQAMIPGMTGLVVPPGDSRALADAIAQLLADRAGAQAMGQAARRHVVANFGANKQAAEYLSLYRRLLAIED